MKTIDQYKEEFIELAKQFEKEHGCSIKKIQVERYTESCSNTFGQEYEICDYSCNIIT